MAKIEEVTALLIDEIATFEKAVNQLQKESEKVQKQSFNIDISQIETAFTEFLKKLDNDYESHHFELTTLQNKLNKTAIIPNWMTILFSSFFIIFILSISFSFYQYQKNIETRKTSYNEGINTMKNHMQLYFNENPRTFKHYQKWSKKVKK